MILLLLACTTAKLADPCVTTDGDADGYFLCTADGAVSDCDDYVATVYPGASEACDGLDSDCDGAIPEDEVDGDGDGVYACDLRADCDPADFALNQGDWDDDGWTTCDGDCDDIDVEAFPGADERCDGLDQDCDGTIDEDAIDPSVWYADADVDGYGDVGTTSIACDAPMGFVADASDCDDADDAVFPDADELCNAIDDNCDGVIDEDSALDAPTWYADLDADAYGDAADSVITCYQPADYADNPDDCDDTDPAVNPGMDELCNGIDDDCDAVIDEPDAIDATTWYADADLDAWGDANVATVACSAPEGSITDSADCDDANAAVNPAAVEVCNSIDDNCDGTIDEGVTGTWYADVDLDSYGDAGAATTACTQPAGTVTDATDCEDADATAFPGGTEACDGADNDCDGSIDEGVGGTWYDDADGDGYGDPASVTTGCTPAGAIADGTDCDDGDADVNPGETEICNDIDDNCDGAIDEGTSFYCGQIPITDAQVEFGGESSGDMAGWAVSGAGDVNNDGYDDVIIGAPYDDDAGTDAGAAYLIFGPQTTGNLSLSAADVKLTGGSGARVGWDVRDAGDVDGDGFAELIIGAPKASSLAGAAYIVSGSSSWSATLDLDSGSAFALTGTTPSEGAGEVVTGVGDLDGDGRDDIVVGVACCDTGAVSGSAYLLYGDGITGDMGLGSADAWLDTETHTDDLSWVAGIGDFDGDGDADFVVSAAFEDEGGTDAGAAYLFHGNGGFSGNGTLADADLKLLGGAGDGAGIVVSEAGDADGDAKADLLVGTYTAGVTYLVLGGATAGTLDLSAAEDGTYSGVAPGDYAGANASGAGDVNGDGQVDVLVGAQGSNLGGSSSGAVYLLFGNLLGPSSLGDAACTIVGDAAGDRAGGALSEAGDVNADGFADFLIGAQGADSSAGRAYLFLGE